MNGIRFHTRNREELHRTQNSGVLVSGEHQSESVEFYGIIKDILALQYMGWRHVYLFECQWFDIANPIRGIRVGEHLMSVNMSRSWYKDEPFVLACQASHVFYLQNIGLGSSWYAVQKVTNRNVYDVSSNPLIKDDESDSSDVDVYQEDNDGDAYIPVQVDDDGLVSPLHMIDVDPTHLDASSLIAHAHRSSQEIPFINDDEEEICSDDSSNSLGSTGEDLFTDDETNSNED
ncbi:uncharacterized protein LOC121260835 [Juglans microcarpa x Juglans regia]|uniref:uncharacterized protein LOC121260835 n=1 Tax=Juglans microcarpa x Juglans regia TaxID=2249226 RepID=UPI001B7E3E37|nr:uncharacterized protein LOC121260835 [Juglans microcarpa x Juglans regia]